MTGCYRLVVVSIALLGLVTAALADAPPGRYTFPASGTVYDTRTKLTWQQVVDATNYTQSGASAYCIGLPLAGGGWRLPNVRELLTLVDPTKYSPAIDPTAFLNAPAEVFWSSSPYVGMAGYAWIVTFVNGFSNAYDTSITYRVRCVR